MFADVPLSIQVGAAPQPAAARCQSLAEWRRTLERKAVPLALSSCAAPRPGRLALGAARGGLTARADRAAAGVRSASATTRAGPTRSPARSSTRCGGPQTWTVARHDGPNHLGIVMRCAPRASNGPNHLGLRAVQSGPVTGVDNIMGIVEKVNIPPCCLPVCVLLLCLLPSCSACCVSVLPSALCCLPLHPPLSRTYQPNNRVAVSN